MNIRRLTVAAALAALAALSGGCAVYPAQPVYTSFPSTPVVIANTATTTASPAPMVVQPAPIVVAPAPVFVAPPPPVFWGPAFYPSVSIGIVGRFGGGRRR